MQLLDEEFQWILKFTDGRVNYIHIDFRLSLDLVDASGKASLTVETPCRLKGTDGEIPITPSESSSLAPILPLFNAKVIGVAIQKTGHLKVAFGDGHTIEVEPDDKYESWQLHCSISSVGSMFVCSPGGSVSLFQNAERTNKTFQEQSHLERD